MCDLEDYEKVWNVWLGRLRESMKCVTWKTTRKYEMCDLEDYEKVWNVWLGRLRESMKCVTWKTTRKYEMCDLEDYEKVWNVWLGRLRESMKCVTWKTTRKYEMCDLEDYEKVWNVWLGRLRESMKCVTWVWAGSTNKAGFTPTDGRRPLRSSQKEHEYVHVYLISADLALFYSCQLLLMHKMMMMMNFIVVSIVLEHTCFANRGDSIMSSDKGVLINVERNTRRWHGKGRTRLQDVLGSEANCLSVLLTSIAPSVWCEYLHLPLVLVGEVFLA